MKSILELSQVSSFRPKESSLNKKLFQLILEGHERDSALQVWIESGRSEDSFRQTYKKLKDELVHEAFFKETGKGAIQTRRILCWNRFQKIKCLLITDKKAAAISLAIETIPLAKKCGFTEIAHSLSSELEHHYGAIEPDNQRYLRYRKLRKVFFDALLLEQKSQAFFTKLVFYYRMNKNLDDLNEEVQELINIKQGSSKYMLYRCNTLTIWYDLKSEFENLINQIKHTITFFQQAQLLSPFTVKTNLHLQLLPFLIAQKHFAEAEKYLTQSLKLPTLGSFTWHKLMFQQAYLGFHSDKPLMALNAWKRASKTVKHNSPLIDERWQIVRAYLAIYEKLGLLKIDGTFRLPKFLNSTIQCQQDKTGDNVAIIIVTLLYLLLHGKKKEYMKKSDPVLSYVQSHLRGKDNIRSKCMLSMLKKVEEGDYYLGRTELRVRRWQRVLGKNQRRMVTENEVVPFEKIWEVVCSQLK